MFDICECGGDFKQTSDYVLLTYPAKYFVKCESCGREDTKMKIEERIALNRGRWFMDDLHEVIKYITAIPNWEEFKNLNEDELIMCHTTLGMNIRNHLHLWERDWEPFIVDGADHSQNHPDAVSMRLIERAWKHLQDE